MKPKSSVRRLTAIDDNSFEAQLHSPPEDGKANKELIDLVAAHFKVRRRFVRIVSGHKSRHKIIEIESLPEA